jgi:hypothetical protein
MTKKENMKKDKRILIPKDEFEGEASEGLGRLSREEAEADLRELKERMESRIRTPRAIWLPAAAAVIILLVASGIFITLLRQQPSGGPELAKAEETIKDTAYIAMAGPIEKEEYSPAEMRTTTKIIPAVAAEISDDLEILEDAAIGNEYQAERPVVSAPVREEPVVTLLVAEEDKVEEVVVQAVPQTQAAAMKARAATETRGVVEAREEKKAVAAKDQAEKAEPAAGAAEPAVYASPMPSGGWEAFRGWAARNIRYPEGIEPVVRQEVIVSFTVKADSTLSDLKAVSSPGEPFTREAFRILLEGPEWVPGGGGGKAGGEAVVVKIVFR